MNRAGQPTGRLLCSATLAVLGSALFGCQEPGPGDQLLVTSGFTDQVFVLDAATGEVRDSVSVDRRPGELDEPHGVAVSPSGAHWYTTVSHGEPTLWKFERPGNRLVGRLTLPTTGASRVRLSPDGELAAVPDYWRSGGREVSQVAVVRTADLSVVGAPEVCEAPHDAVFSPQGDQIAVTCSQGRGVVILNAATLEVSARHALAPSGAQGVRPMNAVWSADGGHLFVSLMARGVVADLDLSSGDWREISSGEGPAQLELSRDGAWLAVANLGDATVSLLPMAGGGGVTVAMPGAHPHGIAFGGTSDVVYVTYEGDVNSTGGVVAVGVPSGDILWHSPLGVFTLGIAYAKAG
jgi:DNA-binding beta-propeller fold protein YncE